MYDHLHQRRREASDHGDAGMRPMMVYTASVLWAVFRRSLKFGGLLISSFYEVKSNIDLVIKSLEMMIQGQVSRSDVAGPVGMFQVIGDSYESAAKYGLRSVILTVADMILLLSANLGVMNLLPIPALDGGRLVFLIVEALRGKPVPRDKEGFVHMIGFGDSYGNHGACHVQ